MPAFSYRAINAAGQKVDGRIEASDRRGAIQTLQAQGLIPIDAVPAGASAPGQAADLAAPVAAGRGGGNRSPARVTLLTRELATLLDAGEPLERALRLAAEDCGDKPLAAALGRVVGKVRGGVALADALAAEPGHFSKPYLGMVRAGEATGRLGGTLKELAELREREEDLKRKLTSAMIYPAILAVTAVAAIGVMLALVVPQFEPLFAGNEEALPAATLLVLRASEVVRGQGQTLLVVPLALLLGWLLVSRLGGLRGVFDGWLLRMPILGGVARERATAQVARGLSSLLKGGLDLPSALTYLQGMVANRAVAQALARAVVEVRQGRRLGQALEEQDVLVPMGLRLIKTGEESGRLGELSGYVAERFEQRLATRLTRLVQLAEPILVVSLGVVVGGIVMAVLTAVLSVNELAL